LFKIIFLLISPFFLFSKEIVVDYTIEFGIVGEVAKVHSFYKEKGHTYQIDAYVTMIGHLANLATNHLKEHHISKGKIVDKKRIATTFKMLKHYGEYKSTTLYRADSKKHKTIKEYTQWKKISNKSYAKVHYYKNNLDYFSHSDMVTLFLNLSSYISNKSKPNHYVFRAMGADAMNGRVDIVIPTVKRAKEMQKLLGKPKKGEWFLHAALHRKIYKSKDGELMIRMGADGIIQKAVLKDIFMYGDVRIIRE